MAHAATSFEGRWEGTITVPGRDLPVVIDLAPDAAGQWRGSATFPGLSIKGAPLAEVLANADGVRFTVKGVLNAPTFDARVESDGTLTGKFQQAGNSAPFHLRRTGPAQPDAPIVSTALSAGLEGEWAGEVVYNGNPLKASLTLTNHSGTGSASFHLFGKRDNVIPVDLVVQDGDWLTLRSSEWHMKYEGQFASRPGEIRGVLSQGPLEMPLVLRRSSR